MSRSVPRIGRVLDVLGVAALLVGAAIYVRAWIGLRALEEAPVQPEGEVLRFVAVDRFVELQELSRLGLIVMAVGAAVAVSAAVVAARRGRDRDGPT